MNNGTCVFIQNISKHSVWKQSGFFDREKLTVISLDMHDEWIYELQGYLTFA